MRTLSSSQEDLKQRSTRTAAASAASRLGLPDRPADLEQAFDALGVAQALRVLDGEPAREDAALAEVVYVSPLPEVDFSGGHGSHKYSRIEVDQEPNEGRAVAQVEHGQFQGGRSRLFGLWAVAILVPGIDPLHEALEYLLSERLGRRIDRGIRARSDWL
jgi:hypothetical protein